MKILVPVDGSKQSYEGTKVAAHFMKAIHAETYLLTVTPDVSDGDLELTPAELRRLHESMKKRGETILNKAVDQLKSLGVANVNTVLVPGGSPANEIVSFAEKNKIDLIVIGSKGKGATARFFLGSVAAKVVRHSTCCVYVVKEPCWTA